MPSDSAPSRADHADHTDPREEICGDIANVAEAYGFTDADHEELTGVREF